MCQRTLLQALDPASTSVLVDRVQAIASGFGVSDTPAAYEACSGRAISESCKPLVHYAKLAVVICAALFGLLWAKKRVSQQFRARNQVEKIINISLALCSGVAILTTVGIVMSMFSEAMRFFQFR